MNKGEKGIRTGNFRVCRQTGGDGHDYAVITTVGGEWEVSFRDDHPMYAAWVEMMGDGECTGALEVLVVMYYVLTNSFVDAEFVEAFFGAHAEMAARKVASVPEAAAEERAVALEEAGVLNAMARGDGRAQVD